MKKILKFLGYTICIVFLVLFISFLLIAEKDLPIEKLQPKYANQESHFLSMMGMQVHYRDEGNKQDSLPIILLHGTSSSLNTWDSVVYYLKNKRRVISLDLPAFGLTGPAPIEKYSFQYYSTFLDSFCYRLNLKNCAVAGNSLGGGIAWHFALDFPKRVKKLVLIDAVGFPKKNEKGSIGFKIASTPIINNLLLYITPKALVRKSLETVYYNQKMVTDAQVERFHDVAIRSGNRKALLSIFKNGLEQTPEKIKTITIPTLILWGEKDLLIDVSNASLFNKAITGSKMVVFPNIGHVPMEESPKKVADEMMEW